MRGAASAPLLVPLGGVIGTLTRRARGRISGSSARLGTGSVDARPVTGAASTWRRSASACSISPAMPLVAMISSSQRGAATIRDSNSHLTYDVGKLYPHDLLVFLKTHRVHIVMRDGLQEAVLRDAAGHNSGAKRVTRILT